MSDIFFKPEFETNFNCPKCKNGIEVDYCHPLINENEIEDRCPHCGEWVSVIQTITREFNPIIETK